MRLLENSRLWKIKTMPKLHYPSKPPSNDEEYRNELRQSFKVTAAEASGLLGMARGMEWITAYEESVADDEPLQGWKTLCQLLRPHADVYTGGGSADLETDEDAIDVDRIPPGDNAPQRPKDLAPFAEIEAEEKQWLNTIGSYLALNASRRPDVQAFRQDYLGAALLPVSEAYQYLLSPFLGALSLAELKACGLSPSHADCLKPSRRTFRLTRRTLQELVEYTPFNQISVGLTPVNLPKVYAGSILADTQHLAKQIIRDVPSWTLGEAMLFLLSGQPPSTRWYGVKTHLARLWDAKTCRVAGIPHMTTLTLPLYLSVDSVAKIYQRIQREAYVQCQLNGRENYRPDQPNRILFGFVVNAFRKQRIWDEGKLSQRQQIVQQWQEKWKRGGRLLLPPRTPEEKKDPSKKALDEAWAKKEERRELKRFFEAYKRIEDKLLRP